MVKMMIIGDTGVGKSCMIMRYAENNFTPVFNSTIGADFVRVSSTRKLKTQKFRAKKCGYKS